MLPALVGLWRKTLGGGAGESRGSLKRRPLQSLPRPALGSLRFLAGSLGGRDPVSSGLHPRPSKQESRAWPQLSKQLTELTLGQQVFRIQAQGCQPRSWGGDVRHHLPGHWPGGGAARSCARGGIKGRAFLLYPWGKGRSAPAVALVDSLTDPLHRGEY